MSDGAITANGRVDRRVGRIVTTERTMMPKTCKEWRGKRVILTRDLETNGGAIFHAGETLIVRRAKKDGTFELYRPAAAVSGDIGHAFVMDDTQRLFSRHETPNTNVTGLAPAQEEQK